MLNKSNYWKSKVESALKKRTESNDLDFKKDLSEDSERLKEHVNAFGNTPGGGLFVFGVQQDFTFIRDHLDHDLIVERVAQVARDNQSPALQVVVHDMSIDGHDLLAIEILPGTKLPVFIKGRDPWTQGAFIRSGSSTRVMSDHEIRDLMAKSQIHHHDAEPIEEATLEQLDLIALGSYLSPFQEEQKFSSGNIDILEDNKVIVRVGSRYVPTLAGWLMFARNPQSIRGFKNVAIEFQQFSGRTRETPVRKLDIAGTLPQQVTLATSTLIQNVWKIPKLQGVRREDIPSYDEIILREALTNAIVHRDYKQLHQPVKVAMFSDRIEIENPGGLLPGLTPLNLLNKRAWRNETIANLMLKAGLGEMDGQGIDRIYGVIRKLRVPAPVIKDERRTFKIILSAPKAYEEYSPVEKRLTVFILLLLEQEIGNESLRNVFGIDVTKASTLLKELVKDGVIYRTTKSMRFATYRLTDRSQKESEG